MNSIREASAAVDEVDGNVLVPALNGLHVREARGLQVEEQRAHDDEVGEGAEAILEASQNLRGGINVSCCMAGEIPIPGFTLIVWSTKL